MASLGIPFVLAYLGLVYNAASKFNSKVALLVILVIILSLFTEQWLNYPLFLGLIFLRKDHLNKGLKYSPVHMHRNKVVKQESD